MQFTAGQKLRAADLTYVAGTGTDAQYTAATAQSLGNLADTMIAFGTTNRATSLLTQSAVTPGHRFTINRSGLWSVSATVRVAIGSGAGERYMQVRTTAGDVIVAQGQPVPSSAGAPSTLSVDRTRYIAAGTILEVTVWQASGATLNTDIGNPGWVRINLAWLRD